MYKPSKVLVLPKRTNISFLDEHSVLDVDVTSHSRDLYKSLSPFLLGDCPLADGRVAKNMENAWQYSKVYAAHINSKSNITKAWRDWSSKGFDSTRADRYPMGKGAVPMFSLHGNKRLSYVDARKQMYAPMYAKLAAKTKAFKILKEVYDTGETIIVLRDFDAYNHVELGMSWDAVINNERMKMGHAFVLAMMLELGETFYKIYS